MHVRGFEVPVSCTIPDYESLEELEKECNDIYGAITGTLYGYDSEVKCVVDVVGQQFPGDVPTESGDVD